MSKLTKALTAAAGNAGGDNLYVEDVFSTYLYEGNGATQTITNGIDLDGEGGLTWIKNRDNGARHHGLFDTERGATKALYSNQTWAEGTNATYLNAFNSNGFTVGSATDFNGSGEGIASWTFRKAEKFFDIVTWTGNGDGTDRYYNHNLNSVPNCVIVKRTDASMDWGVYHSQLGPGGGSGLKLNTTDSIEDPNPIRTTPSSTQIRIRGASGEYNENGATYVAYLFASDAGGFGDDGSENIIKCGSYVGTSDTAPYKLSVDVGFEPQWLLVKNATTGGAGKNWLLVDTMRGFFTDSADLELRPNTSDFDNSSSAFNVTSTGFSSGSGGEPNIQDNTYIYIAIRRPMKTPESGTEVFAPVGATSTAPLWKSSFPVDAGLYRYIIGTSAGTYFGSRLTGTGRLESSSTAAEVTSSSFKWDYMNGWFNNSFNDTNYVGYNFKRATGFMDVVAYTGTGVNPTTIKHNLGVPPELIICKSRTSVVNWHVGPMFIDPSNILYLDAVNGMGSDASNFTNTPATSTEFYVGNSGGTNPSAQSMVAYLFASVAGVSKVGSYTGTEATLNVDCGFAAGARFILIKRSDAAGAWYVWDSFRGIVAGNDPYWLMNSTAAEVTHTDYIDPLASGFTVTSLAPAALNASGGNYIFLAIA